MSVKYKTPEIHTASAPKMDVGTDGVPQEIIDALSPNGMIQIKKDPEKMMEYASSTIYDDPTAAVRELVSNEARQGRIAIKNEVGVANYIDDDVFRKMPGNTSKNPHIVMSLRGRQLIIHGKNTMGMTVDEFSEIYLISGRSGNLSDTETGMFGIGKLAYRAVSDTMKVETFARKTGEKYGFIVRDTTCKPVKSTIRNYGTRVTLQIRENVNIDNIKMYMNTVGRFLGVDTYVKIDGIPNDKIGPESMMHYMSKNTYHDRFDKDLTIHIKNSDYELLISPQSRDGITSIHGIPIHANIDLPTCFLNILNEKKYAPTATRDSLEKKSQDALQKRIRADLCKVIAEKTRPENSFRNVKFARFLIDDIDAAKYVPEESKWKILGCDVSIHTKDSYSREGYSYFWGEGMANGTADDVYDVSDDRIDGTATAPIYTRWMRLHEVLMLRDNMFYQKPLNVKEYEYDCRGSSFGVNTDRREIEEIFSINPDAILITYHPDSKLGSDPERMLKNLGIQSATSYIMENQTNNKKNRRR